MTMKTLVTQKRHAAVRAQGCVGDEPGSARARVLPDLMAGARIERETWPGPVTYMMPSATRGTVSNPK